MTFEPLWIPKIRKILGAFFAVSRNGRTNERTNETDFIDPSIFNRGPKMVLTIFTQCLVPEIFVHFCLKSSFLGLNSSRTKEITAKPMVLSYVGHFYKHLNKNWKNPWSDIFVYFKVKKLFFNRFTPISPCQMSIFGQNWFHIVGNNTFSYFCANIFQNLPSQSWKNDFFNLKSAFLCNFEAKYQPNQRNYS